MSKKRVLLKLTGNIFTQHSSLPIASFISSLIAQIKALQPRHQFGIVMGGGNFFRGSVQGKALGLRAAQAHQMGMLATMMNGIAFQDLANKQGLDTKLFSAVYCPEVASPMNQAAIDQALNHDTVIIFSGGTGNPFFTTDTSAVLRSLQMAAGEIWKGTSVDGVYTQDPATHTDAVRIPKLTYTEAIERHLGIMDLTAYSMAEQYRQKIRVFNIFAPNALSQAAHDNNFGSTIE